MNNKIYVASSWRNEYQPGVVELVRSLNLEGVSTPLFEVFDYKNPVSLHDGKQLDAFYWDNIDPNWKDWSMEQYTQILETHPVAIQGYNNNVDAMYAADICIYVLPAGISASLIAGAYALHQEKHLIIYIPNDVNIEPELMFSLADEIVIGESALIDCLKELYKTTTPDAINAVEEKTTSATTNTTNSNSKDVLAKSLDFLKQLSESKDTDNPLQKVADFIGTMTKDDEEQKSSLPAKGQTILIHDQGNEYVSIVCDINGTMVKVFVLSHLAESALFITVDLALATYKIV